MNLHLKDKVIIVSGGAGKKGSIGRSMVMSLLEEEAIPAILDLHSRGNDLVREIQKSGREVMFAQGDLTDPKDCERGINEVLAKYGRIDGIINNLGANDGKGFQATYKEFMDSLKLNLVHYFLLVKFGLEALKASKGNIVNIGSKVGITGQGNTSAYAAAKGAVLALTREWALELAPFDIRSNAIVIAEAWTPSYDEWASTLNNPDDTIRKIKHLVPLGKRMTKPSEIADLALFLLSERSSHITGQHIHIDGGYVHLDRAVGSIHSL